MRKPQCGKMHGNMREYNMTVQQFLLKDVVLVVDSSGSLHKPELSGSTNYSSEETPDADLLLLSMQVKTLWQSLGSKPERFRDGAAEAARHDALLAVPQAPHPVRHICSGAHASYKDCPACN